MRIEERVVGERRQGEQGAQPDREPRPHAARSMAALGVAGGALRRYTGSELRAAACRGEGKGEGEGRGRGQW